MRYIDLRSDTVTQPTEEMRLAMANAPVGDDVYGDDPTVNELEATAARILGKEAALYVTSGTMGNQLAVMSQTKRGDEVIVSRDCHIMVHEVGAAAVLSGVTLNPLSFPNGVFDAAMMEKAIRSDDIHEPPTTLMCMENALANGRVVPLSIMRDVYAMAKRHNINVHLDGARLFNAATALETDVKALTAYCDTVSCCLSKGLCAPVGSILAGPKETVLRARKYRKMLGGGMRQCGIIAAGALCAITEMPDRLKEDHENARYLAEKLQAIRGIEVALESVQINMVFCKIDKPLEWQASLPAAMLAHGVKIGGADGGMFRFVTNRDVSRGDLDYFLEKLQERMNG